MPFVTGRQPVFDSLPVHYAQAPDDSASFHMLLHNMLKTYLSLSPSLAHNADQGPAFGHDFPEFHANSFAVSHRWLRLVISTVRSTALPPFVAGSSAPSLNCLHPKVPALLSIL